MPARRWLAGPSRFTALARCALLAGAATGCAPLGDWLHDRGGDLADVLQVHVVAATGADLKLEATHFLAVGGGFYEGSACGLAGRHFGTWHERIGDFGLALGLFNHHWEWVVGVERVSGSWDFNVLAPLVNEPVYSNNAPGLWSWFSLRATAVVFLGVDVNLRLGELADFFAGLAGYDPSGDDTSARRYTAASGW